MWVQYANRLWNESKKRVMIKKQNAINLHERNFYRGKPQHLLFSEFRIMIVDTTSRCSLRLSSVGILFFWQLNNFREVKFKLSWVARRWLQGSSSIDEKIVLGIGKIKICLSIFRNSFLKIDKSQVAKSLHSS